MVHILQFFEKSSQKLKQTIWASQKCKNDIKYENPGENGPLGQKLGHFATIYSDTSPDHRCTNYDVDVDVMRIEQKYKNS